MYRNFQAFRYFGLSVDNDIGLLVDLPTLQHQERRMISFEEAEIRSKIIKAMAHPVRLMLIDELKAGERSFSSLFDLFELDKSTVSKHLLVLKEAGIVSSRKYGADMVYSLEVPCVTDFFGCVTAVIENNVRRQQICICKAG
jgi:ArsR family transcriptional regulator